MVLCVHIMIVVFPPLNEENLTIFKNNNRWTRSIWTQVSQRILFLFLLILTRIDVNRETAARAAAAKLKILSLPNAFPFPNIVKFHQAV